MSQVLFLAEFFSYPLIVTSCLTRSIYNTSQYHFSLLITRGYVAVTGAINWAYHNRYLNN